MSGARPGGARADIHQCIAASRTLQAACEAAMEQLAVLGERADSESMRLLRQCAEICALNAKALEKESHLARRTTSLCFELSNQLARARWLEGNVASRVLARDALQLAHACQPLLFS